MNNFAYHSKALNAGLAPMLLLTGLALLSACASNPTGGTNFVLMSERAELEKGKELHEELLQEQIVYQDAALNDYVARVGQKMAAISHRAELDYIFTVIDNPEINAFALPGGYVYINRGLLTLLTSEAQLAAVLGHEIGHITARHAVRQQTAARTSNVASTVATVASVFATGTNVLGETANLFGGALISGYGREMELEADELGAEYLQKAGYNPDAMIEVISVLKNHEDFQKKTANRGPAYHGVFATHPRNDTRLQQAVRKADALEAESAVMVDPAEFRARTSGLVMGPSLQNLTGAEARNRYYQQLLNYTLVLPDQWSYQETPTTLTASDPQQQASLSIEVRRLQQLKEPRLYIRDELGISDLQQSEPLQQFGLAGHTGLHPDTGERIAVLYYERRAFVLTARTSDASLDNALLESIRSFRPIARNEGVFANPLQVEWVQANGNTSYAALARNSRIPQFAEETLRLMNGHYPAGEPRPGDWIKIVR